MNASALYQPNHDSCNVTSPTDACRSAHRFVNTIWGNGGAHYVFRKGSTRALNTSWITCLHGYVPSTSVALVHLLTKYKKQISPILATSHQRLMAIQHLAMPLLTTVAIVGYHHLSAATPLVQHNITPTVGRQASTLVPYPLGGCSSHVGWCLAHVCSRRDRLVMRCFPVEI